MYRGFNLILQKENLQVESNSFSESISQQKKIIEDKIGSFIGENGSLDGSKMQTNWFPQIKVDIFLSHSHKDEKLAIALAGWLKETFGLTTFIDSCVWGFSNKLLKEIDGKYCRCQESKAYDYQKRNYSTSHVHMMLSVALAQMIDNTECLFFLNTPNSITPADTIIEKTESPWIYSEIAMSRLVRKKSLDEHRETTQSESSRNSLKEGNLKIQYDLPTDHLVNIEKNIIEKWVESCSIGRLRKANALDELYRLTKQQNG